MKSIRYVTVFSGLVILAIAIGFILQIPLATSIWPWPDGRLSYLFIGSILAAVSAAALWIGWTGEFGALPAGSLNILVIAITTSIYFFHLALEKGRPNMIPFGMMGLFSLIASGAAFLWSRRIPLNDSRSTPALVRVSFGIFIASLILAGSALIFRMPIFPWALNPDSSVIFGCIFVGDAFYFLYSLLYPRWHNALGQLLSFLAYDLVLIVPFLLLFKTVKPEYMVNLIIYVAVLIYSGAIAIYFLFINSQTRFGS
jgi:hypothetical protein